MNENPSKPSAARGGSRPEIITRLPPAPAAGEFTLVPTPGTEPYHPAVLTEARIIEIYILKIKKCGPPYNRIRPK